MGFWKSIQDKAVANRLGEEALYEAALEEFETGTRRRGLWAKAIVQGEGDQARAEAAYLKLLVTALRDDLYLVSRAAEMAGERKAGAITARSDPYRPAPRRRVHPDPKIDKLLALCHRLRTDSLALDQYQALAAAVNASLTHEGFFGGAYVIQQGRTTTKFKNLPAMKPWFVQHVLPAIEATP